MTILDDHIANAAAAIHAKSSGLSPKTAVILGSGLGAVADLLQEKAAIPYTALSGFPQPGVEGHEGSFRIGTVGKTPVYFLKGRVHLYEGKGSDELKVIIRTLKTLGVETLIVTNAAGGLNADLGPGTLMAIEDHLNMTGTNPLMGANDDNWGPRFPSMENAWDADLREQLFNAAKKSGVTLYKGVYCSFLGPTFETPAEVRMARILGADAVGMSTVADNIIARHAGLKCVGISVIVNRAAGMGFEVPSHEQTLKGAAMAETGMAKLLEVFISSL